jgi:hypothetical protein
MRGVPNWSVTSHRTSDPAPAAVIVAASPVLSELYVPLLPTPTENSIVSPAVTVTVSEKGV